jgi:glycosidase
MSASDSLMPTSEQIKTPQNYKIEIGTDAKFSKDADNVDVTPSTKLIGLTKEQLEQYRNDPFWKPVRYALFVLFWLVWLAMFVGAILIVVLSPKCAIKKEPKWFENAVTYQLYTPTFRDSDADGLGDFKGIQEKLNDLRRIGINAVWPRPIVQTVKDDFEPAAVLNHSTVDPRYGTEQDLTDLISATHSAGLYFIADLPLTVAKGHEWDKPDLILKTASNASLLDVSVIAVSDGLLKAAAKYLEWGADGIHLAESGLADETKKNNAVAVDALARRIREISGNYSQFSDKEILIFADDVHRNDQPVANSSLNYLTHSLINRQKCASDDLLTCLEENINAGIDYTKVPSSVPPVWTVADLNAPRVDLQFPRADHQEEVASLVTMLQLFLPGPVNIFYGEELALPSNADGTNQQRGLMRWSWDNTTFGFSNSNGPFFFKTVNDVVGQQANFQTQYANKLSALKAFRLMANLRNRDEIFQTGNYTFTRKNDLHVYRRFVDNPLEKVYLLVLNWPEKGEVPHEKYFEADADLVYGRSLSDVYVAVPSARTSDYTERQTLKDLTTDKLTIKPYQGLVLRFKP